MRSSRSRFTIVLLLGLVGSCARGFDVDPAAISASVEQIGGGTTGSAAGTSGTGAAAGTAAPAAGTAAPTGGTTGSTSTGGGMEPCLMGETQVCTCTETGTMGTRLCYYEPSSPLGGYYGECQSCAQPTPAAGTGGSAGGGDVSGSGGTSGTGGTGGTSGSGGSGGSGGSPPPPPPPPPSSGGSCSSPCTQSCFPIGILPCCTTSGRCGCTWAPGAYCF